MLTEADLEGHNGTGEWHRHTFGGLYTNGVKLVADKGGAYWLLDAVFSYQGEARAKREEFQVWTLRVEAGVGRLAMTDGNTDEAIIEQAIEWTDFPLAKVVFWLEGGVLMLPSER